MTKKLTERMDAAMNVMEGERVRWLLGKKIPLTQGENVFGKQMAEALDMDPSDVLRHFIALRKWRLVEDGGEKGGYLLFRATTEGRAACQGE